ncbi:MAG TPA: MMPL family transporter [Polyangia bacterium]|nr:MMPL family transporter [Polyangia bacterium]
MSPDPSSSSSPAPGPLTRRFVAWTLRHGALLWVLAALVAIPATWRTVTLYGHLRSDVEELLPRDAPSVVAIDELRRRMAGLQYLGVIVDVGAPDRLEAGERFLSDLAARVRAYPKSEVSDVRVGFAAERAFVEKHAGSLIALDDLKTIRERIEARLHWEYGKKTDTLLDEDEPAPALDFSDIEKKYAGELGGGDLEGNRFSNRQLGLTLMLIEVGGFSTSAAQAGALIHKVEGDMRALGGTAAYAPGMRVGLTGDVAISAEEMAALVQDLTLSSALVVVVVLLAIVLFYGWVRSIPALFLPLGLAAVYAFGLASLPPFRVTELNSNTAFLGSIIIGNGINFGIIQLARYLESRRQGKDVEEALAVALWGTRWGTLSAALAAGVAYGSLVAMQFRGFRQFGVIGGLGMLFAWGTTVLLMPPLLAWLDRGRYAPRAYRRTGRLMGGVAQLVARRPWVYAGFAALLTVGAVWEVRQFGRDRLEYDFSRLRRRDTWKSGEGYWGKRMDTLLGRYLTPTVILTDSAAEARAVTARLRAEAAHPPLASMIASIRTWDDVVPPDEAEKQAELAVIRRKMTPNVRANMTPTDRQKLDRLIGPQDQPPSTAPVRPDEVPDVITRGLRERDGTVGRAVLVYPNPAESWWRGETIATFVKKLRQAAEAPVAMGGRPGRVAGGPALSFDIISSMERDGPLASALAFLGVVATVLLIFRRGLATPFVIGSLVVGVLWLLALTMVLEIKINFVNFIAFPITFGIGVDYAVNVMARYLRDGGRDVVAAVRGTGGAVGLCSLTTVIGYSSLLVAQNVGLFLFGLLAVFGELCCLTTAVVVLPAVLMLIRPRSSPRLPEIPWDSATVGANGNGNGNGNGTGGGTEAPGAPRIELGP